ncbi:MAG TPA: TonB-dependent receptor [Steroidobacter sp.]
MITSGNNAARWLVGVPALLGIGAMSVSAAENTDAQADEPRHGVIAEVFVTATKREESVQDVPIAITALSGFDLENRGIQMGRDIAAPNFVFPELISGTRSYISVRGIFQEANQVGVDTGFSVYLDGVYKGRNYAFDSNMFDVERIEILRGPQGTLFGKNTIAGVTNIITKKPSNEFEGSAQVEFGNFDLMRGRGSLNIPLVDDVLAVRFAAQKMTRDGFVTNLATDSRHKGGETDITNANVQVLYTPTASFKATLAADYLETDNIGYTWEVVPNGTLGPFGGDNIPYTYHPAVDPLETTLDRGVSLTGEYEFGGGYVLTSITGGRKSSARFVFDEDVTPYDLYVEDVRDRQELFSQELRLASPKGQFIDYVLGLYYYDEQADMSDPIPFGVDYPGGPFFIWYNTRVQTTDYAAFAHANLHFTDAFSVYGGVRYTDQKKELEGERRVYAVPPPIPDRLIPGLTTDGTGMPPQFVASAHDKPVTWEAGVRYDLTDGTMLYAEVSTGFKSAGFDNRNGEVVKPEHLKAYEIGAKAELFDKRAIFNVAAFYNDYTDLQVRSLDTSTIPISIKFHNAASVVAKGVDLELQALATDNLSINLGAGYVHSVYKSFPGVPGTPGGNADGNRLPMTPPWTINGGVQYSLPLPNAAELVFNANANFVDGRYQSLDAGANLPTNFLDSYTLVNGRLTYRSAGRNWELSLWGRNLLNTRVAVNRSTTVFVSPGMEPPYPYPDGFTFAFERYNMPRNYGVTWSVNF